MGRIRAHVSSNWFFMQSHAYSVLSPSSSMLKNVKGQSEQDNRKRMAVLNEILDFFKKQARKG